MPKSKCTCKHRHPSQGVRDWNFTHSDNCYYAEVRKQEAQERTNRNDAQRLYSHYRRANK